MKGEIIIMKHLFSLLICIILLGNIFAFPVTATEFTENDQIMISQTVENLGNGYYFIETIYVPAVQPYSNTKTGTKTAQCIVSGTTIYTISVTGTFTYDGSTSDATSASCKIATYVENATINSRNAYTSGASAVATGSVTYNGINIPKTVTLTCDKNGNLS